jgi:DmsE family decaheme c-type cytochrome
MLKIGELQLCNQCHADVKPQFSLPFRHRVEEGLIMCSDCHDPHDISRKKLLRSSTQQEAVCTKCHTETAGPFVYEHPVLKTEGCTACHVPHGGQNPHLSRDAKVDTICRECHYPSVNSSTGVSIESAHNPAAQTKSCIACHADIHGSNVSPVFANN